MSPSNDAGISPALVESVAGLSAGSMATLIVHPLDIVKTRMQIYRSSTNPHYRPSTVSVLRSLSQSPQPLASLYRGLTPNLIGNASSWASFFFFKSRAERFLIYAKTGSGASSRDVLGTVDFFASSAMAGAMTQALTNPIWVLKTRMLSSDKAAEGAYPSMLVGAQRIFQTEGIRGFYRGLMVSMIGVSHGAVQFAVYEPAKKIYFRSRATMLAALKEREEALGINTSADTPAQQKQKAKKNDPSRMTNEATIAISSVSKLVAGAVTYPYQVLRSRLQNYDAEERFGRGIRGVATKLWREEGVRGFYRGVMPGVVRVMPATWVTFLVYENVKYYLPRWFA